MGSISADTSMMAPSTNIENNNMSAMTASDVHNTALSINAYGNNYNGHSVAEEGSVFTSAGDWNSKSNQQPHQGGSSETTIERDPEPSVYQQEKSQWSKKLTTMERSIVSQKSYYSAEIARLKGELNALTVERDSLADELQIRERRAQIQVDVWFHKRLD